MTSRHLNMFTGLFFIAVKRIYYKEESPPVRWGQLY